jgi:hypothetical protein
VNRAAFDPRLAAVDLEGFDVNAYRAEGQTFL